MVLGRFTRLAFDGENLELVGEVAYARWALMMSRR